MKKPEQKVATEHLVRRFGNGQSTARARCTLAFGKKIERTMSIVLLEAIQYPDPSRDLERPPFGWRSNKTPYPEWEEIEVAIRRLDRDEWPFVWLHTEAPPNNDMPNNMFCVMGGRGEYDLCLYRDGDEMHYWNPARSEQSICIWESDQGAYKSYQNLCEDLSLVLRIIRQFAVFGTLYDAVQWDTW